VANRKPARGSEASFGGKSRHPIPVSELECRAMGCSDIRYPLPEQRCLYSCDSLILHVR